MDALNRREKIIWENAFEQKKKKPGLKFNPGLALIGLRATGPWCLMVSTPVRIEVRGTQREYSLKPLKHSIAERILEFKR